MNDVFLQVTNTSSHLHNLFGVWYYSKNAQILLKPCWHWKPWRHFLKHPCFSRSTQIGSFVAVMQIQYILFCCLSSVCESDVWLGCFSVPGGFVSWWLILWLCCLVPLCDFFWKEISHVHRLYCFWQRARLLGHAEMGTTETLMSVVCLFSGYKPEGFNLLFCLGDYYVGFCFL